MSTAPPPEGCGIAVFAKAPVAGRVKTRLAGMLGDDGAAGLHAGLVRHALATAVASRLSPLELWCAPDGGHDFFARCASDFHAGLREQRGEGLGERMRSAFSASFAAGRGLVLIGSDCPALTPALLREAAMRLAADDAVLAPAEDGGYVLVGLSREVPGMFDGVDWGSARVMAQSRERLGAAGARWSELPTLWDVDRPDDYERLLREGLLAEVLS